MSIDTTMYISDLISTTSIFLIIIGGIFTCYQWIKSLQLKRAEYVKELTDKVNEDDDLQTVTYLFDYSKKWYDENFHGCGEFEKQVDKTLLYFSYVCYLKQQKLISKNEFSFFEYRIKRTLMNSQVQDYFYNLYHFSKKFDIPFTFDALFEYGKSKKIFKKDFYDANSHLTEYKYHRYINF